jgi:hypothetical protein
MHWFEIVRRPYDRYSWLFVEVEDGRRRVLARSDRDYRSAKRLRSAIEDLREVLPGADVVDATGSTDPDGFELPASGFRFVSGVVPLVVEEGPVDYGGAVARRRGRRTKSASGRRKRNEAAVTTVTPAVETARAAEPTRPMEQKGARGRARARAGARTSPTTT